jgi:hypothetical protein
MNEKMYCDPCQIKMKVLLNVVEEMRGNMDQFFKLSAGIMREDDGYNTLKAILTINAERSKEIHTNLLNIQNHLNLVNMDDIPFVNELTIEEKIEYYKTL